ncbi:MAG: SAV_915 family protein [Nocardioides sp.]
MIELGDGRVALLGYAALDRFIDARGEHQKWLLFDTRQIDEIQLAKPFDVKLLDVQVPESFRAGPAQEVGA